MHELEMKLKPICEAKEKLAEWCKAEVDKGKECINVEELSAATDMVKDLAEAEEKCVKACYYKTILTAMKEEEEENERMGYDHWRTSSGRYAPKGTGHWTPIHGRSGYPMPAEGDWRPEYGPWGDVDTYNQMMGYDNRGGGNRSQGGPDGARTQGGSHMSGGRMGYSDPDMERYMQDERHGRPYKEWKLAKRHYTETKSDGDKMEMREHAKEHMADTAMTMKEIWTDADPELRNQMKANLTALLNDLK